MRIEVEIERGVWASREVTFEQRRELLEATPAERRFVAVDGTLVLAHAENPWCELTPGTVAVEGDR